MWGPSYEKCCELLSSFGLLEARDVGRIRLTAYLMNYAEQTIDKESSDFFNHKLIEYFEQMMRQSYNQSADRMLNIKEEQNNVRLCVERIFNKNKQVFKLSETIDTALTSMHD